MDPLVINQRQVPASNSRFLCWTTLPIQPMSKDRINWFACNKATKLHLDSQNLLTTYSYNAFSFMLGVKK